METKLEKSLSNGWFYIGENYIQASKNMIDRLIEIGNKRVVVTNYVASIEEFHETLRYNSQSIILPTLFCLYQGIEHILKGFVCTKGSKKTTHDAESLCSSFSELYPKEIELSEAFAKFISNPPDFIKEYKQSNGINDLRELYNSLRYPDKRTGGNYDYFQLQFKDNKILLPQIQEMRDDIDKMIRLSVILFRKLEFENVF